MYLCTVQYKQNETYKSSLKLKARAGAIVATPLRILYREYSRHSLNSKNHLVRKKEEGRRKKKEERRSLSLIEKPKIPKLRIFLPSFSLSLSSFIL